MSTDFTHRLKIWVGILVLVISIFVLLIQFGGPRIRNIYLDQSMSRQQVVLTYNTAIEHITDVTITPAIPISYSQNSFQLIITFARPLSYNTEYTVVADITDTRGKSAKTRAIFSTDNPQYYFLTRNDNGNDAVTKGSLSSQETQIVHEAETIILYDFTPNSMLVLQQESDNQSVLVKLDNDSIPVTLPADHSLDAIDGSVVQDTYLCTLLNQKTYEKSLWVYSVTENSLRQVVDDQDRPVSGSDAHYGPDGLSIFYQNNDRSLVLLSSDQTQPPISIGVFEVIRRILPSEKGVFGITNNAHATILSVDGTTLQAPDFVQDSSLSIQLNTLSDYVFITQRLDKNRVHLEQNLTTYIDEKRAVLRTVSSKDSLILNAQLSPNDEFIMLEEADQPVIYDGIYPNGRPKNGITNIIRTDSGNLVKTIWGYDIKWVL